MDDRADLIDKLKRWAWSEQQNADDAKRIYPKASEWYAARAALLREAVKALEGGTTNDPVERYCYVNCGLPAEQCACYRSATKAT